MLVTTAVDGACHFYDTVRTLDNPQDAVWKRYEAYVAYVYVWMIMVKGGGGTYLTWKIIGSAVGLCIFVFSRSPFHLFTSKLTSCLNIKALRGWGKDGWISVAFNYAVQRLS